MLYTKNINITTTGDKEVLEIPQGFVGHWNMLFISNLGGSTDAVTVYVDKADGTDMYILNGTNVSSKEYLLFSDATLVLQPQDIIKASTSSAGNMEIIVTVDILYQVNTFNNF